jgi:hypothetical protein
MAATYRRRLPRFPTQPKFVPPTAERNNVLGSYTWWQRRATGTSPFAGPPVAALATRKARSSSP